MKSANYLILLVTFLVVSCTNTRNSADSGGMTTYEGIASAHLDAIEDNLRKTCKDGGDITIVKGLPLETSQLICTFYQQNDFQPIWTNGDTLNANAEALADLLERSYEFGLLPRYYHSEAITTFIDSLKDIADNDPRHESIGYTSELLLTNAWFLFATHLSEGHIDQDSLWYTYKGDSMKADLASALEHAESKGSIVETLVSFEPKHPEYVRLRNGLTAFLNSHELTDQSFDITSYKEDSVGTYAEAKEALIAHGFAGNEILDDDSLFVRALKNFQDLHGLNRDGKVGRYTAFALNRSNMDRFEFAAASLERMRWNDDWGDPHVYVNIAGYKLSFIENGEITREHRTVTGAPKTKTPVFSAKLEYMNVNPYWHVPYSIASKEILPSIKKDTAYLQKHGYQVFTNDRQPVDPSTVDWENYQQHNLPYRFRQNSGWGNSLGLIAFMFPNEHSVFIHDTPAKIFFRNDVRAYSHGCVRLDEPHALAKHILALDENKVTADSLDSLTVRRIPTRVNLKKPIDVHIRYHSVAGDSLGRAIFYKDIYGWDEKIVKEMFRKDESLAL